jgi:hypothetical protein
LVVVETTTGQYTTVVAAGDARFVAEVDVDRAEVDAGDRFLAGGAGFPPATELSLFFSDEPTRKVVISTSDTGQFLAWVPVDINERGGRRTVVAQAADGTLATSAIDVVERPVVAAGMPGYGLGG